MVIPVLDGLTHVVPHATVPASAQSLIYNDRMELTCLHPFVVVTVIEHPTNLVFADESTFGGHRHDDPA